MAVDVGPGAAREILVVLALAIAGLVLAMLAAFTPWYGVSAESRRVEVVEMHAPPGVADGSGVTAAGGD